MDDARAARICGEGRARRPWLDRGDEIFRRLARSHCEGSRELRRGPPATVAASPMSQPAVQASPRAAMCAAIDENAAILSSYLPAHVTPARFIALAPRAVLDNPDLWDCSSSSVLKALAAAAASGLPIDGKMSSLIVRKSKHGKPVAVWDPSYRGMVYLCLDSSGPTLQ